MSTKKGKVAKILNKRELVINIGSDISVEEGMLFDVMDKDLLSIKDPDTGEDLGSISRPKIRVKAVIVERNLSIVRTYKTHRINVGGSGIGIGNFAAVLDPPRWVDRHETLKLPDDFEPLKESESIVNVGDVVISVGDADKETDD